MGPTIAAVLGTYSRGDLVALGITLAAFILKGKRRLLGSVVAVGCLAGALAFLPTSWYDRMQTIDNYTVDDSLQGRINSWVFALRLASDRPLTGGGFTVVNDPALYFHYVPNAEVVHNFHSIYFEVLGEHGWVGLSLFLGLIVTSLMTAQSIIRMSRGQPDRAWAQQLAAAIQISIVGYCAAGTFLNLGFYDLFYVLVAILVCTKTALVRDPAGSLSAKPQPITLVPAPQPTMSSLAAQRSFLMTAPSEPASPTGGYSRNPT